ncbi:DNA gyrase inhibitor YacG [Sphingomonas colocasiae]|uniref:DNA gyrase inhibitor YacG n=1 Tax=Sphingomonas colocasiae TaxID=1848973 RepID=A0ABS7PSR8_9SPHN|nr:DNA gyrase inhibitor YacG [Sphingomonas colocasiae]MBY8824268.1 DNA gyrase inhibitor YacG [Sphingomonas colocasiae]
MSKTDACPLCGAQTVADHAPFCSRGCKDRDLLRWLGEGYRIPGPPAEQALHEKPSNGLDSEH